MLVLTSLVLPALLLGAEPAQPPFFPAKAKVEQCTDAPSAEKSDCHHGATPAGFVPQTAAPEGVVARGEKLSGAPKVALADLLASPAQYTGKTVQVQAHVRKACERKGCWMELAEGNGPGVRVTFKDYAFFVPTQSAGYLATVEGEVQVATLSDERAKHYASEGATVPKGPDGKPQEVQLVARGVELRK